MNSEEKKLAIANYIVNLYESIVAVSGIPLAPTEKSVFGSHKDYNKFNKKVTILDNRTLENFFKNKDYHNWLLGNIIDGINIHLDKYADVEFGDKEIISKGEFFDIFLSFLKELKLDKNFDKFIKDIEH